MNKSYKQEASEYFVREKCVKKAQCVISFVEEEN